MTNVVIGGASGIGAATAPLLDGPTIVADLHCGDVRCDITDQTSIDAALADIDRLDALVLTAGVSPVQADVRTVLNVDLAGVARVLDAVDPLVHDGTAAVVVSSMAAHLAGQYITDDQLASIDAPLEPAALEVSDDPGMAYAIAKLGVQRIVRRTATAWGPRGGRILSLSPGVVATPMGTMEMESGSGAADLMAMGAFGRPGRPEEIAAVIAFVCSPAASFMTGTDVLVDGGVAAAVEAMR